MQHFGVIDTTIVVLYLGLSVVVGLVANKFVTGLSGYLVAGRSLGTALSIATMTGSELGLITVMYQAQKGFTGGFAALHIGLIAGLVTLAVGLTGFIVVRLRRTGVMTIPEFYRLRFDKRTRVLGGLLLALGGILNMGLFLQVGSQFVVGATGLDPNGTTIAVVMTGLLALVLFYTVMGGMVSVVLTDYIQFVVLSMGLLVLVGIVTTTMGFDHIVEVMARERGPASFDPTQEFGATYISWQAVLGLVSCAIWPTAVTRALSARDESVVKKQMTLSSISFMVRFLLPCFLGIAAFVFLVEAGATLLGPDGGSAFILAGQSVQQESIMAFPIFFNQLLPVGALGLLTAAMLAAFMSTHDSYLLCWASVIARDIIAPLSPKNSSEDKQLFWTRIFIVLIGLYVLFWGLFYTPSQDVWDYLGITGAVYSTGAIVVLTAGLYWKKASSMGATWALLAGLTAVAGLGPVKTALRLEAFNAAQIGLVTLGIAAAAMVAGSLLFPDPPKDSPIEAEAV